MEFISEENDYLLEDLIMFKPFKDFNILHEQKETTENEIIKHKTLINFHLQIIEKSKTGFCVVCLTKLDDNVIESVRKRCFDKINTFKEKKKFLTEKRSEINNIMENTEAEETITSKKREIFAQIVNYLCEVFNTKQFFLCLKKAMNFEKYQAEFFRKIGKMRIKTFIEYLKKTFCLDKFCDEVYKELIELMEMIKKIILLANFYNEKNSNQESSVYDYECLIKNVGNEINECKKRINEADKIIENNKHDLVKLEKIKMKEQLELNMKDVNQCLKVTTEAVCNLNEKIKIKEIEVEKINFYIKNKEKELWNLQSCFFKKNLEINKKIERLKNLELLFSKYDQELINNRSKTCEIMANLENSYKEIKNYLKNTFSFCFANDNNDSNINDTLFADLSNISFLADRNSKDKVDKHEELYKEIQKKMFEINNENKNLYESRDKKYTEFTEINKSIFTLQENINRHLNENFLVELKKKIVNFDKNRLSKKESDYKTVLNKKEKLSRQKHLLLGEFKQLEKNKASFDNELKLDYADISNKYSSCYIEVKTLEFLITDIDQCIKKLDKSIVEYHKEKIYEVNLILKDLWMDTYKGNDIDYIQLKSQTADNKSYNYKVVMIKNNVELELRGRCSAGQKVLTSILFRIALGDAFAQNFSILALDEPTTNLDAENVEALAETLLSISKKKGNDFQLIIITHDDGFVNRLSLDGVEMFYRVSKDSRGDSRIEKCSCM